MKHKLTKQTIIIFLCIVLTIILLIPRHYIRERFENNINNIYVSLTTIPSRIHNLENILDSLLSQTHNINEILLNIPTYSKRFKKEYSIPEFLKKTKFNKVKVIRCNDYGPGTKLLGALEYLEDKKGYVIIVDDDRIIDKNLVKSLYDKQINNIESIIANKGTKQELSVVIPWGAGGISIPISMLNKNDIVSFFNKHKAVCRYVDDVFWYKYFVKEKQKNIIYHQKIHLNNETNGTEPLYLEKNELSRYNTDKTIGLNQKCFEN